MDPREAGPESWALALANSTSDFLIVLDAEGKLRYANPAFCRAMLGGQSANGQDLYQLVDQPSGERARALLASVMASSNGESQQAELFHYENPQDPHDGGRARPIFYTFSRIDQGIAAVGHDKTPALELLGEIVQLNMQLEEKQAELADANIRLERLAVTDQITGLYNRHHFFHVVQHMFEEARRYRLPLCCFMLDVDFFKSLNDSYGHVFGDRVLRGIADRLRRNTRRSDILARYGGEEFVMVAPNTDLETAALLAERLRSSVEVEKFVLGSAQASVTISVGYAGTELVSTGPFDDLLQAADKALYNAKQSGRNRSSRYVPAEDVGVIPKK